MNAKKVLCYKRLFKLSGRVKLIRPRSFFRDRRAKFTYRVIRLDNGYVDAFCLQVEDKIWDNILHRLLLYPGLFEIEESGLGYEIRPRDLIKRDDPLLQRVESILRACGGQEASLWERETVAG